MFSVLCLSGTWMMTGNGVMHNGTTILDEYGHNLDRLKVSEISFYCSVIALWLLPIILLPSMVSFRPAGR